MRKAALWKQIALQKSASGQSSTARKLGNNSRNIEPQRKRADVQKTTRTTRRELSPVSKARWREKRRYSALKKSFLRLHLWCGVYPLHRATHVHHSRGRLGALLTDTRYWVPVSAVGHQWIHDNPEAARAKKWWGIPLLCKKGKWNTAS